MSVIIGLQATGEASTRDFMDLELEAAGEIVREAKRRCFISSNNATITAASFDTISNAVKISSLATRFARRSEGRGEEGQSGDEVRGLGVPEPGVNTWGDGEELPSGALSREARAAHHS